MKIYLAGPMRGIPQSNFPAFDVAAERLRADGHEVFNPADHDRSLGLDGDSTVTTGIRRELFRADTDWICREADAVALLPGWEKSLGATAERALALAVGLEVIYLDGAASPVESVLSQIRSELIRATSKHGPMRSAHEGYAVLKEEVDELWDDVKANNHRGAVIEAVQVAAMAARFVLDVGAAK